MELTSAATNPVPTATSMCLPSIAPGRRGGGTPPSTRRSAAPRAPGPGTRRPGLLRLGVPAHGDGDVGGVHSLDDARLRLGELSLQLARIPGLRGPRHLRDVLPQMLPRHRARLQLPPGVLVQLKDEQYHARQHNSPTATAFADPMSSRLVPR